MLIYGSIKCQNCKVDLEWFYNAPDKLSSGSIVAVTFPKDKIHANKTGSISQNKYLLEIICNKCDNINRIEYQSNRKL